MTTMTYSLWCSDTMVSNKDPVDDGSYVAINSVDLFTPKPWVRISRQNGYKNAATEKGEYFPFVLHSLSAGE